MLRVTAWTVGLFGAGAALARAATAPWTEPVVLIAPGLAQSVLAAMILSMLAAPLVMQFVEPVVRKLTANDWLARAAQVTRIAATTMARQDHVIVCGYGRSGQNLARLLDQATKRKLRQVEFATAPRQGEQAGIVVIAEEIAQIERALKSTGVGVLGIGALVGDKGIIADAALWDDAIVADEDEVLQVGVEG